MIKPGPAILPVEVLSVDPLTGTAVVQVTQESAAAVQATVPISYLAQYYHNDGSPYWPPGP